MHPETADSLEASPLTASSSNPDQPSFQGTSSLVKGEANGLVEVYSDRLCAVTHAFALCSSVLQKSSGR